MTFSHHSASSQYCALERRAGSTRRLSRVRKKHEGLVTPIMSSGVRYAGNDIGTHVIAASLSLIQMRRIAASLSLTVRRTIAGSVSLDPSPSHAPCAISHDKP